MGGGWVKGAWGPAGDVRWSPCWGGPGSAESSSLPVCAVAWAVSQLERPRAQLLAAEPRTNELGADEWRWIISSEEAAAVGRRGGGAALGSPERSHMHHPVSCSDAADGLSELPVTASASAAVRRRVGLAAPTPVLIVGHRWRRRVRPPGVDGGRDPGLGQAAVSQEETADRAGGQVQREGAPTSIPCPAAAPATAIAHEEGVALVNRVRALTCGFMRPGGTR
jgi:hypothetical protein